MTPYSRVTTEEQMHILGLHEGGKSTSFIADRLNRSWSTIDTYIKAIKVNEKGKAILKSVKKRKHFRKVTPADEQFIILSSKRRYYRNLKSFYNDIELSFSYQTFLIICKKLKIRTYKKCKVVKLSPKQIKRRLEWCKKMKGFDFKRVWFSDESYIELDSNGPSTTVRMKGEPIKEWDMKMCSKWPDKILLWGYIHSRGGGTLVISEGSVNGATYRAIIKESLVPNWRRYTHQDIIFQQDNAIPHTADMTVEMLEDFDIEILDWPANSPDISPIENIWGYLKKAIGERGEPQNIAELILWIEQMWDEICEKHCPKLYDSIQRRIEACIKARGKQTKY